MNKIVLALAGFVALSMQQALTVYEIGTYLSDLNKGVALGFQDDSTDTATDCYLAAADTSVYIQNIFDSSQYIDGNFNTPEMMSMAQTA